MAVDHEVCRPNGIIVVNHSLFIVQVTSRFAQNLQSKALDGAKFTRYMNVQSGTLKGVPSG